MATALGAGFTPGMAMGAGGFKTGGFTPPESGCTAKLVTATWGLALALRTAAKYSPGVFRSVLLSCTLSCRAFAAGAVRVPPAPPLNSAETTGEAAEP